MNLIFSIFPFIFILIFCFVFGTIISTVVKSAKQNHQNTNSPRITSDATVVTKRTKVWGDHSHTVYFATFQFESGDRLKLEIPPTQFGYLVEGDKGKLTFQGNRFMSFERM